MTSTNQSREEPGSASGASGERSALTWGEVVRFLRYYRWTIVAVFLTTVIATYSVLSLYSDKYDATAKVLVRIGRETMDPPPTTANRAGSLISTGVRKEEVTSEVQILGSQEIAERVVDEIGPDKFKPSLVQPEGFIPQVKYYLKRFARGVRDQFKGVLIALGLQRRLTPREEAINGLLQEMQVAPERDADVITIRLRVSDPGLGTDVLRKWISVYLVRRVEVREYEGVLEFLERETAGAKADLERTEAARNAWKQERALSQTMAQKDSLIQQIRGLSIQFNATQAEVDGVSGQIAEARQLLENTPRMLKTSEIESTNPPMQIYQNELAGLELQKSKLLATYEPQSERVKLLEEEIARLRTLIQNEEAKQITQATLEFHPLVRQLESQIQENSIVLEGLKARARLQSTQKQELESELRTLESADATLASLEREKQIAEDSYLGLVRRRYEAEIMGELDLSRLSNVAVLAAPTSTIEPVAPRRKLIMGVALILGLLLGVGLSLLYEYLSGRVRTAEDVTELTNLPYLGSVILDREAVK